MRLKDVENLDGFADADELAKYRDEHKLPYKAHVYAMLKEYAMRFRALGDIEQAMEFERSCQFRYDRELRGKVDW